MLVTGVLVGILLTILWRWLHAKVFRWKTKTITPPPDDVRVETVPLPTGDREQVAVNRSAFLAELDEAHRNVLFQRERGTASAVAEWTEKRARLQAIVAAHDRALTLHDGD